LGLIKLLQKEFDFCEESQKVDKPCPLAAGDQYLQHTVELPKEIPPGRYNVHILVYNYDDEPITCLDAKAEFKIIPKFGL
ncbi:Phosphatidylglycerol/phosphatidylinositol transfer protein, partial [Podila humilis]